MYPNRNRCRLEEIYTANVSKSSAPAVWKEGIHYTRAGGWVHPHGGEHDSAVCTASRM
jgi:hypothetical protein